MLPESSIIDYDNQHLRYPNINDKLKKITMIVSAYALVDPNTVMIHAHNTSLTYRAMVRPFWFVIFTDKTSRFSIYLKH